MGFKEYIYVILILSCAFDNKCSKLFAWRLIEDQFHCLTYVAWFISCLICHFRLSDVIRYILFPSIGGKMSRAAFANI